MQLIIVFQIAYPKCAKEIDYFLMHGINLISYLHSYVIIIHLHEDY